MNAALLKKVLMTAAAVFFVLMAVGWVLLTFFFLEGPLYLWVQGEAPPLCYLIPPCVLLALAAGAAVWVRETLERMRSAYGAITAKLQSQVDRLEAEVRELKQAPAQSKCED